MQRKVYEALCGLNEGYEQVRRNLKILARHPGLQRAEVRRFERWAAEMCAATTSYLLEALGARETDQAGRLFVRRKARERQEEEA